MSLKNMKIFETMKIAEFSLIIRGKWSELELEPEPEPELLTNWSRSRPKIDRLRITGLMSEINQILLRYV
jgi:hypothetical protein